jgi:putative hydrolase of the HAD superfamily
MVWVIFSIIPLPGARNEGPAALMACARPCYQQRMLHLMLLDLDNTLYPESRGMDRDITRRMNEYVAAYLGISVPAAMELRRERARRYGTTLEWLTAEEAFADPEDFFAAVHPDGEEYCIERDPELARALDAVDLPKAVLTNSPSEHAERVLAKLGVADRFEAIYDIRFNALLGKPHPDAYRRACEASGAAPEDTLFVDDMPKYVRGFLGLGGRGLLVDEAGRFADEGLPRIRSMIELPAYLASLS